MLKRILSGAVGISLIIVVLCLSSTVPVIVDIAIALVCAIAVGEFTHATGSLKLLQISIPSIAFAFIYPMLMTYNVFMLVWYIYTAIMLSMMIFFHKTISFKEFAYTYSMSLIITFSLSAIISMKDMDVQHSALYFVITLALPWLADAGAYFVGSFMGKHKLCPEISPKKTVEGAVGGVIVCILATCGVGFVFANWIYGCTIAINYLNLIILSLIGSLLSILGDLSFSLVKRSCNIKDYGNIIPGHGGILDRFDSVIFVAPFLLIMTTYLPIIS